MPAEFKWKTTFVLHSASLKLPISVDGIEFTTHPKSSEDSPMVCVTYRFTTLGSPPDVYKQAKQTIGRFLDLAAGNSALHGLDIRGNVTEFDVDLENRIELQRAGVNPGVKLTATFRNNATWNKEFVEWILDWSKKIAAHNDAEIIFRVLHLLRQSVLEEDEYDRLSKVWRGFNALYRHVAGGSQPGEGNRIRNFAISLHVINSDWLKKMIEEYWTTLPSTVTNPDYLVHILIKKNWRSVMDCLIKQDFELHGMNYSKTLATAVSARDAKVALENALLCIYMERNRVMHGEIISEEEREVLYVCAAFLQRIVAVALNEFYFIPMQASSPSSSARS